MVMWACFPMFWGTQNSGRQGKVGWPEIVITFETQEDLETVWLSSKADWLGFDCSHKCVLYASLFGWGRAALKLMLHPLVLVFQSAMWRGVNVCVPGQHSGKWWNHPSFCRELKGTEPRSLLKVSRKDLKSAACSFVLEMTGDKDETSFDFSLSRFCGVEAFSGYHGIPSVCAKDPVCSGGLCFRKNLLTT